MRRILLTFATLAFAADVVTFRDGVVEMENLMTETRHELFDGNRLDIGGLIIEIQTDSRA